MPRLKAISKNDAGAAARPLLEAVEKKLGMIPTMMQTMANAPAVLEAYLGFSGAMTKGQLPAKLREQLALVVGESNACQYCLAAHSTLGKAAGLSADEMASSRRATAADRKAEAALAFAHKLVHERGKVADRDVEFLRTVGYDDGAIAEIVAHVALNVFTNYFNLVAQPVIDFPKAPALEATAACAC